MSFPPETLREKEILCPLWVVVGHLDPWSDTLLLPLFFIRCYQSALGTIMVSLHLSNQMQHNNKVKLLKAANLHIYD